MFGGAPRARLRPRPLEFFDDRYEWRRLSAEVLGTFFLVFAAVGAGVVAARFGGQAAGPAAQAVAPGLMVGAAILFMGAVSGAHLNPAVTIAFALRRDFPWRRVPGYLLAQAGGSILAALVLVTLLGHHGSAGLTQPGPGVSVMTAMLWEVVLTVGLVTTILGTSSGAQNVGPLAAIGVASYIALAGLMGSAVSGASMNPARSLGPDLVMGRWTGWWAYAAGPVLGALIAVGIAFVLRGPGGGPTGKRTAQGTLGLVWAPQASNGEQAVRGDPHPR